jgi:hypothetical protein
LGTVDLGAYESPVLDHAPIANAGTDQTKEATGPTTPFTLDGSASSDPDNDSLTYVWKEGSTIVGTSATVPVSKPVGVYTFTLTVSDPYGASDRKSVQVTIQDTTPPSLSGVPSDITVISSSAAGAVVTFATPTATDLVDGSVPVTCSPVSGATFKPGKTTVTCTATDAAGNPASKTFTVWVQYAWSGFLSPLNKQSVNRGSTIPVKFALTGASAGITTLSARLYVKAPGAATETLLGTFKYDPTTRQYQFNWTTSKSMSAGTYTLRADLGDGVQTRTVSVQLN